MLMVQDFINAGYRWLLGASELLKQFALIIVIAVAAAAAIWLGYRRLDPEGHARLADKLRKNASVIRSALLLALLVTILAGVHVQARKTVETRWKTISEASASRRREPYLSGVVQFAPAVAVIEEKTYERTLTLPPEFVERVGGEGLQVLSPYLYDPSAENVTKLVDSFKRSGRDVVFTRALTRLDEVPVPADAANLHIDFKDEGAPGGRHNYEAEFQGEYRFRNPRSAEATMRFAFNLPEGGGTVQEFSVNVAGVKITEPNESGLYVWKGSVPPSGEVVAKVHYRVTGGALFDYRLGSERRRIGDFHMVTSSSQPPQFTRSGIYPTSIDGANAEWRLKEVLTSQSISLVFPPADLHAQLLEKSMSMLPVSVILFAIAALAFSVRRAIPATAAFGLGLLGVQVLSAYAEPVVATFVGVAAGVLAGGLVLGSLRGWVVAVMAGVAPMVFLTVEHGALTAWILALIALVLVLLTRKQQTTAAD